MAYWLRIINWSSNVCSSDLLDVFYYIQQAFEVHRVFGQPATAIHAHSNMKGNFMLEPIFFSEHIKRVGKRISREHMVHRNDPRCQYAHAMVGKAARDVLRSEERRVGKE